MAEPRPQGRPQGAGQGQAVEDPLPPQVVGDHAAQGEPKNVADLGTYLVEI